MTGKTMRRGRQTRDAGRTEVDERTLRVVSLAMAAFEAWKSTGVLADVPDMTPEDWAVAEQYLEGA